MSAKPADVCSYLSSIGLETRPWINYGQGEFGCSTPYHELDRGADATEDELANNIAFYVDGTADQVTGAYLVLNVNMIATSVQAHEDLLGAAKLLIQRMTGMVAPKEIQDAIHGGSATTARVGRATVRVLIENWPTGRGYDIRIDVT